MLSFKIDDLETAQVQHYLQHAVAPRPICLASTVDQEGQVNLSPFSFFNMFSIRPPVCIFSPSRRMRDNTHKHTLENVLAVPEVVINIVNYDMVQQTSLSSAEYPKGVNEFVKAGFTQLPSEMVRPPRVKESPVQLECRVEKVIPLAETGGAGNLVLAHVVMIHVREEVLDKNGQLDQAKLDLVARLGGSWYCRAGQDALFDVTRPFGTGGIGVDRLPDHIRHSNVLTGNQLAQLANVDALPSQEAVQALPGHPGDKAALQRKLHLKAAALLDAGKVEAAWKLLLQE